MLIRLSTDRIALLAASLAYGIAVVYCLARFASVEWAQYGFSFVGYGSTEVLLLTAAACAWSAVLPTHLRSPADVVLLVVYLSVCIPAIIVPLGLERIEGESLRVLVVAIIFAFIACCILVQRYQPRPAAESNVRRCSAMFVVGVCAAWGACLAAVLVEYRDVMTLVSLDAIYEQREVGAATSRLMGYAQTYLGYVLSPALLALGLTGRRPLLIALGVAGGIVLYSVTAEKNAFAFPFLMIAFNAALARRSHALMSSAVLLAAFAIFIGLAVHFYDSNLVANFLAWYVGVRSILTPGLFAGQYLEFFSSWGYTHLSHVTGIGALVEAPPAPGSDPRWPSIGHIVGEQYIGFPGLNANASFLASDGIAAFGIPGVFVAFGLLAAFLVALNHAARDVPTRFVLLIALPLGLILTNVSLFTVLLSFGGLFWLVVLTAFFRADDSATHWRGLAVARSNPER